MISIIAIILGLLLLLWSADRFVEGSAAVASHYGMPPLLIGMLVVGFGTSAPEMIVSALSAFQGSPGIALGNAYGSNITNIALILGLTAIISPITVHSQVLKKELPILALVTALTVGLLLDKQLGRLDAFILLAVFSLLMSWSIWQGTRKKSDSLAQQMEQELDQRSMSLGRATFWLFLGLILLIISSRVLVWGAVDLAHKFGVSDLVIGLTIVAIGTSLPELASSIIATRRGEHDIALGNVLGSNLFNTLAVVGIAGVIKPLKVPPEILFRDLLTMGLLTVSLFVICYGFKGRTGKVNRVEGLLLLIAYAAYSTYLLTGIANP
ncbi:cation:H+ antiporter [Malonomonas rubra DSM 5091]|uniref:Cation:H+ antiporter n=1 Tax=Malonomonas rubra DSM 5091 TaxID=1122189 RepID=A0A1M6LGL4_MALRU|nr:calcium/sodium antiporter [Malonomonas rubra]SHJ70332.1 cation:H+ antiporter [Malonomonas rubra DSM 5091]